MDFKWTAKGLNHTHTCIHSPGLQRAHPGCQIISSRNHRLYSRSLKVIHFKYSSVCKSNFFNASYYSFYPLITLLTVILSKCNLIMSILWQSLQQLRFFSRLCRAALNYLSFSIFYLFSPCWLPPLIAFWLCWCFVLTMCHALSYFSK